MSYWSQICKDVGTPISLEKMVLFKKSHVESALDICNLVTQNNYFLSMMSRCRSVGTYAMRRSGHSKVQAVRMDKTWSD